MNGHLSLPTPGFAGHPSQGRDRCSGPSLSQCWDFRGWRDSSTPLGARSFGLSHKWSPIWPSWGGSGRCGGDNLSNLPPRQPIDGHLKRLATGAPSFGPGFWRVNSPRDPENCSRLPNLEPSARTRPISHGRSPTAAFQSPDSLHGQNLRNPDHLQAGRPRNFDFIAEV
jgi:hypothetical protein